MELLEAVQSVLQKHGITFREEDGEIISPIALGLLGAQLRIREIKDFLRFSIMTGLFCPDYRRLPLAEAICRCNWQLRIGAFWLDMDDGEVRFHVSIPTRNAYLIEDQIEALVFSSWSTAHTYIQALVEVATSEVLPETAIARAEASLKEKARADAT